MKHNTNKGEFLLRHIVSIPNNQTELEASEKITERLVMYTKVVCIRSYVKKANNVDFVTEEILQLRQNKHLEYLHKRGHISKIICELPDYFIQVNQSTIINLNFLTGKSATLIEVCGILKFTIGQVYRKGIEQAINGWLSPTSN